LSGYPQGKWCRAAFSLAIAPALPVLPPSMAVVLTFATTGKSTTPAGAGTGAFDLDPSLKLAGMTSFIRFNATH